MSYLFDESSERGEGQFTSTYGYPITIACWVKKSDWTTANDYFVQLGNNDLDANDSLALRNAGEADSGAASSRESGGTVESAIRAFDTAGQYDGVWLSLVGVFTGDSSRTVYYNTIAETTADTNIKAVTETLDFLDIGNSGLRTTPANGYVAEVAIWDSALSSFEIANYLNGGDASTIDPSNLIGYWPLSASGGTQTNQGVDAGGDITITSATFDADHPIIGLAPKAYHLRYNT